MISRFKHGDPGYLSQRSKSKNSIYLDIYKDDIIHKLKLGISASRIGDELINQNARISHRTVRRYCSKLKEELADLSTKPKQLSKATSEMIKPYMDIIKTSIVAGKPISELYTMLKEMGYTGSYSLLCSHTIRYRYDSNFSPQTHKISRFELAKHIWSGDSLSEYDLIFIKNNWSKFHELEASIRQFRHLFSEKDVAGLLIWTEKNLSNDFAPIRQFANGLKKDWFSIENALRYPYSNGILEGYVNKLKAVKRTMYGRANYSLVRAKMLLSNR